MAKDDYFVNVYKILAYLYVQLKSGENIDEKLISTDGPLCQINEKYWTYIWINLIKSGYISGVRYEIPWGHETIIQI